MTSIVEKFGGKRRQEPMLPALSPTVPPTAQDSANALAFINGLNDEVAVLRAENATLRADLNLCRLRNQDIESQWQVDRSHLEQYRRYAVEMRTNAQTLIDVATRISNHALGETGDGADSPDMAITEIAKKYGAGGNDGTG